jgi:hypothetical protein
MSSESSIGLGRQAIGGQAARTFQRTEPGVRAERGPAQFVAVAARSDGLLRMISSVRRCPIRSGTGPC